MSERIVLATKIGEAEATVFQQWCKSRGKTPNEVLCWMIECILQTQNDQPVVNEKLQNAIQVWDNFREIEKMSSVLSTDGEAEVVQTIYFINQKGTEPKYGWRTVKYKKADGSIVTKRKYVVTNLGKEGGSKSFAVLVEPSNFGQPVYSTDINEILDEVFVRVAKSINRRLRKISKRLDTSCITETLTALCDYYERNEDEDHEFIHELFSDNSRHEYGRDIGDVIQYKRRHKKGFVEGNQLSFIDKMLESPNENENQPPGGGLD